MELATSKLSMTVLMTPDMANFSGNVHGGTLLKYLDEVAYACAARYAGCYVVTLSVDQVIFREPVRQATFDVLCKGDRAIFDRAARALKSAHDEVVRIFGICFPDYDPFRFIPSVRLTRTLFENFDMFRRLHPALDTLRAETMVTEGLAAPLHDGAARLYREKGWIK